MPTYYFVNHDTGEKWTDFMSITARDELLERGKGKIEQLPPTSVNIVAGVSSKHNRPDDGFREVMSRIAEKHPTSAVAEQYGDKGIKAANTRRAVNKWRKKLKQGPGREQV